MATIYPRLNPLNRGYLQKSGAKSERGSSGRLQNEEIRLLGHVTQTAAEDACGSEDTVPKLFHPLKPRKLLKFRILSTVFRATQSAATFDSF